MWTFFYIYAFPRLIIAHGGWGSASEPAGELTAPPGPRPTGWIREPTSISSKEQKEGKGGELRGAASISEEDSRAWSKRYVWA